VYSETCDGGPLKISYYTTHCIAVDHYRTDVGGAGYAVFSVEAVSTCPWLAGCAVQIFLKGRPLS
jgi:hypothetical protein